MGLPIPGDGGNKYQPSGYKIAEVGPDSMRGKGGEYIRTSKERLIDERRKVCPFARPKHE